MYPDKETREKRREALLKMREPLEKEYDKLKMDKPLGEDAKELQRWMRLVKDCEKAMTKVNAEIYLLDKIDKFERTISE